MTALAYNILPCDNLGRDPGTDRRVGRSNQLESPPPKGLLQRIRAHGISESTTTHSRPKSQASHTAKFNSGLLFTQSRSFVQYSPPRGNLPCVGVAPASIRNDAGAEGRLTLPAPSHSIEQCVDCRPVPWPVADMVQPNDPLRVDDHVTSQLADIATRHPETPSP